MKIRLFWVTLLLFLGAAFYLVGLDYGRPLPEYSPSIAQSDWLNPAVVFHPDAYAYVGIGYRMLVKGQLFPGYYDNPSLNIYSDMALFAVSGAQALPHHDDYGDREIAPFSLYVMAQALSALFSVITIALAYVIGRMAFSARAGLVTASLAGFSPLAVEHAHYATPNAETTMFATATLLMALVIVKYPTRRSYVLGGLLIGFTAAARYNAVLIGIVVVISMLIAWQNTRLWRLVALGFAAIPIGFIIGTPGALGQRRQFFNDVIHTLNSYKVLGAGPGWTASNPVTAEFIHWSYTSLIVVGPVAILFALVGLVALFQARRWFASALAVYLVVYSLIVLPGPRLNANLLLPLIGPIALLAAIGLVRVWERLDRRYWPGLVGLLLIWPVVLAMWFDQRVATPDTRMLAQAWIYVHVPKHTAVHMLGGYNVPLDPLDYPVKQTFSFTSVAGEALVPEDSPIIVYSDASPWTVLRAPSLADNVDAAESVRQMTDALHNDWKEIARFPRQYWPGQAFPADDVSYWHQMEIVVYCKPDSCPAQ